MNNVLAAWNPIVSYIGTNLELEGDEGYYLMGYDGQDNTILVNTGEYFELFEGHSIRFKFTPFSDLTKTQPDGTVHAVEIAKMAMNEGGVPLTIEGVKISENLGVVSVSGKDTQGDPFTVFIHDDFEIHLCVAEYTMPYAQSHYNQVAIITYALKNKYDVFGIGGGK
jgi:hypothetical protein